MSIQNQMSAFTQKIAQVFYSKLAKASLWLFIGSLLAGALGYVFQIMMARLLSTAEYGLFNASIGLISIICSPLAAMMFVISKKISEYSAKNKFNEISDFFRVLHKKTLQGGFLLLLLWFFILPLLRSFLKTETSVVLILGCYLLLSFLPMINNSFLQGLQEFNWLSISSFGVVLLKIILACSLVFMGFGVVGAIGGVALAALLSWVVTYKILRQKLPSLARDGAFGSQHLNLRDAMPILVANVSFALLTQTDLVLVNYYFSRADSGIYSATAILGKVILYLPGGIAMALFPMVAQNNSKSEGSAHLLYQALGLVIVLCGLGTLGYVVLGEWLATLLYGQRYIESGRLLGSYALAMMPLAMAMVIQYFLIAKGIYSIAYVLFLIATFQVLAFHFFHPNLLSIILLMGASGTSICVVGGWMMWRIYVRSYKKISQKLVLTKI